MQLTTPHPIRARRLLGSGLASVLLHALIVLACFVLRRVEVAPMRLPGSSHGSRVELAYMPGRAPLRTAVANARATPQAAAVALPEQTAKTPVVQSSLLSPNAAAAPTPNPDSATGADALGEGNVSIALASFFPRPKPDLSSLAQGSAGDVILDVVIDSAGKISGITVTHSISPGIDQTVIATVQQWTFRPATRDGQPIASEQELHFHYERG